MHAVGVNTVGECRSHVYRLRFVGEVDEGGSLVASGDFHHCPILACEKLLGLAMHGAAEMICSHYFGVEKLVIAPCTDAVVAPVIFTGAVCRTAEE